MCSVVPVLAVLTACNVVLMLLSINLPVPNGCFMPIFVTGAISGRLYGEIVHQIFQINEDELPVATFAVVGAAALTAGATQTLSAALITLELTNQLVCIPPPALSHA